jgi:hypothetical protein
VRRVQVLCIPLAATTGTLFDTRWSAHVVDTPAHAAFTAIAATYLLPASALCFAFNSWINLSWMHWPVLARVAPPWVMAPFLGFFKALAPLRLVQVRVVWLRIRVATPPPPLY